MVDRIHTDIIAYHGWGYAPTCWQPWQVMNQPGWRMQRFDRGYFGTPFSPSFEAAASTKIIFAHSYGLHLCPKPQLQQADWLIIFSSFIHFHPEDDRIKRRSVQILDQMVRQFQDQPKLVLDNFRSKCCSPASCAEATPTDFDQELLLEDLKQLGLSTVDMGELERIPHLLILQGDRDRIVSPAQAQQLHEKLPTSQYFLIENAGHALPFTHFQECWSIWQQLSDRNPFQPSLKTEIAIQFGRSSTHYHSQAALQKTCADRLLSLLDFHTVPEGKILEIGCGTGFITQGLVDRFFNRSLEITDLSAQMLSFCQANLDVSELKKSISFRQLDGENLDEDTYALIVAGFVVQWFQNPADGIQQLLKHLQPDGLLLISFPSGDSFAEWQAICQQLSLPFTANPLPDPQLLQQIKIDGDRLHVETESIGTKFSSAADFFRSLKAIGAGINTTGKQLSRSQMKQLIQAWDRQSSGAIEVHHHVVYGLMQR